MIKPPNWYLKELSGIKLMPNLSYYCSHQGPEIFNLLTEMEPIVEPLNIDMLLYHSVARNKQFKGLCQSRICRTVEVTPPVISCRTRRSMALLHISAHTWISISVAWDAGKVKATGITTEKQE